MCADEELAVHCKTRLQHFVRLSITVSKPLNISVQNVECRVGYYSAPTHTKHASHIVRSITIHTTQVYYKTLIGSTDVKSFQVHYLLKLSKGLAAVYILRCNDTRGLSLSSVIRFHSFQWYTKLRGFCLQLFSVLGLTGGRPRHVHLSVRLCMSPWRRMIRFTLNKDQNVPRRSLYRVRCMLKVEWSQFKSMTRKSNSAA